MLYIFVSIYVFMTFKHMFSLNKKKKIKQIHQKEFATILQRETTLTDRKLPLLSSIFNGGLLVKERICS